MNQNVSEAPYVRANDSEAIRREVEMMFAELARGRPEVQPSKYWMKLNRGNQEQLFSTGFENFRRTVAKDYFTWTRMVPWDEQFRFLLKHLPLTTSVANVFRTFMPPKHQYIPLRQSLTYNFLSNMVWDYAVRSFPEIEKLSEPAIGNPPQLHRKGRLISQDLANSGLEAQFILANVPQIPTVKTVCELGAGYGRTAHALLTLRPDFRYVVVDIPPALYVSQRYLSAVYPQRKVFKCRPFNAYADIKSEFESAELAFLLPSQLELLPDECFDLFLNISSLHEMSVAQIRYYFRQIHRLTRQQGCFYLKQWKVSPRIPYHDFVIRREDYPFDEWKVLVEREARVQTHFFEALLEKP
jgi:putative sugar O-methyltransferase